MFGGPEAELEKLESSRLTLTILKIHLDNNKKKKKKNLLAVAATAAASPLDGQPKQLSFPQFQD